MAEKSDPLMSLLSIPYLEVMRLLAESGAQLVDAAERSPNGPKRLSHRHYAVKQM